jgi:hypothetical protein
VFEVLSGLGNLLKTLAGSIGLQAAAGKNTGPSTEVLTRFANLISVATLEIHAPLRSQGDIAELKPVLAVAGQMLKAGFFSCLREFEDYILHLGKVSNRNDEI